MNLTEYAAEEREPQNLARLEVTLVASIKLMKRTRRDMKRMRRKTNQQPGTEHNRRSMN